MTDSKLRELMSELLEIIYIKGIQHKKTSMVVRPLREITDELRSAFSEAFDKETMIDKLFTVFVETIDRNQNTFGWKKKDFEKIFAWIEELINYIETKTEGNWMEVKNFAKNHIYPVFKAEVYRDRIEYWNSKNETEAKEDTTA